MEITRAVYSDGYITVHMLVEGVPSCAKYQVGDSDPEASWDAVCSSIMASVLGDSGSYRPIIALEYADG